jgi:hypothetical protein
MTAELMKQSNGTYCSVETAVSENSIALSYDFQIDFVYIWLNCDFTIGYSVEL